MMCQNVRIPTILTKSIRKGFFSQSTTQYSLTFNTTRVQKYPFGRQFKMGIFALSSFHALHFPRDALPNVVYLSACERHVYVLIIDDVKSPSKPRRFGRSNKFHCAYRNLHSSEWFSGSYHGRESSACWYFRILNFFSLIY